VAAKFRSWSRKRGRGEKKKGWADKGDCREGTRGVWGKTVKRSREGKDHYNLLTQGTTPQGKKRA